LKVLIKILFFSLGGILAGLMSLVALTILIFPNNSSGAFVFSFSALIEETVKLLFLLFLLNFLNVKRVTKLAVIFIITFGAFFSVFELMLLLIDKVIINYTFLYSTALHIATSLLLLYSLDEYGKGHKLSTMSIVFFVLAFFLHLCYNLVILKI
jgi:hypothetical protein